MIPGIWVGNTPKPLVVLMTGSALAVMRSLAMCTGEPSGITWLRKSVYALVRT